MKRSAEVEADIACAVAGFPWIEGIYALDLSDVAREHPDAFELAIVLSPYGITELVQTHYAIRSGVGAQAASILYVNGAARAPVPLGRARRISLDAVDREAASRRIEHRRADAALRDGAEARLAQLQDLERAFRQLAEQAARDAETGTASGGAPYRGLTKPLTDYTTSELQELVERVFRGAAIVATLGDGRTPAILQVVPDPFPTPPRRRLLIADDDPTTDAAVATLDDVEVTFARDGWTAVEHLTTSDFDLALCSVVLGEFSGAQIHRMVAKLRPQNASRIVFVARDTAVAQAPPSSASGRVLARPVDPVSLRALLRARVPETEPGHVPRTAGNS